MRTVFPIFVIIITISITGESKSACQQYLDSYGSSLPADTLRDNSSLFQGGQGVSEYSPFKSHQLITLGAIRAYQKINHSLNLISCPMYPSCSEYGYLAFSAANPIKASLLTVDRLYRCGHDLDNYPIVEINSYIRFNDPFFKQFNPRQHFEVDKQYSKSVKPLNIFAKVDHHADLKNKNAEELRMLNFAQSLIQEQDYDRAITEFKRILSYYPESSNKPLILSSILQCYFALQRYQQGIGFAQRIINDNQDLINKHELQLFIGLYYLKLGDYLSAKKYSELAQASDIVEIKHKSYLLEGLSSAFDIQWQKALQSFTKVPYSSNYFQTAQKYNRLSQAGNQLKYKNPTTAGFLAVLPGMGYLYGGYKQTALTSFLINGLFTMGTVLSFQKNNEGMGVMFSTFNITLYLGNIYGSVVSVQRRNSIMQKDHLSKFNLDLDF